MQERSEKTSYLKLMDTIGWFFYDLFLMGYVEDSSTGLSFCLPRGMEWAVYIEVDSVAHHMHARITYIYASIGPLS